MPADDYVASGGGALRLKGAKVQKVKKKESKSKSKSKDKGKAAILESSLSASKQTAKSDKQEAADDVARESADEGEYKTEAERRHDEANRKKMQRMLEDPALASEIRKTHKERVEGLNTYLSKLSEHHDMPKIGPG
ncbi:hypothetical protein F5Y18DRAFT_433380 [Xylariaceae sp. FL1019]|nr:hypothetical protein F5Y18DRAFT_433380 [Xylariaceae sp. FL1019]